MKRSNGLAGTGAALQGDLPRRMLAGRLEIERRLAPRQHELKSAEHHECVAARGVGVGEATKRAESEPVAVADAGLPGRRVGLRVERAGDVVDQAVIVGVEAERTQRLHHAQQIRDDHHERPGEEHDEQESLARHALGPLGVWSGPSRIGGGIAAMLVRAQGLSQRGTGPHRPHPRPITIALRMAEAEKGLWPSLRRQR